MDFIIATDLSDVRFEGASGEPLFEKRVRPTPATRRRFAALVVLCLLIHATIVYLLVRENAFFPSLIPSAQEIPIQIVIEPPPDKATPPPPAVQNVIDEKPAEDAPRTASDEKTKRDAPDEVSQTPHVAPPPKTVAPQPVPEKKPNPPQEPAPRVAPETSPSKSAANTPDAAVIGSAETSREKPVNKDARAETEAQPEKGAKSLADLLADFKPLPDYKVGSAAKASPVGGGRAKTTYLSILYGIIMPHLVIPPRLRGSPSRVEGEIAFNIDGTGKLTYQAVIRSSGLQDLDAAALAAIRWSSPFPKPPYGLPIALTFSYTASK